VRFLLWAKRTTSFAYCEGKAWTTRFS